MRRAGSSINLGVVDRTRRVVGVDAGTATLRRPRPDGYDRTVDVRIVAATNRTDALGTEALRDACKRLNHRKLQRDGRRLRFAVEPPPSTRERFD